MSERLYTTADKIYRNLIEFTIAEGTKLETRNHETWSNINLPWITFTKAPLVTLRKTAWKKALLEIEWFLSGGITCPEKLLDWWGNQLDSEGDYLSGYGQQLRSFGLENYDQIDFIRRELKAHPNSRRLITTTWHPWDMENITRLNNNPNTPTTCHGSFTQHFVRDNKLWIKTYQRSADMLLGVPHNWIQYWAYLLWLANTTGYEVGGLIWGFGDAHVYTEESHKQVALEICETNIINIQDLDLIYTPTSEDFKASDFSFKEPIPEALIKIRPKLL